VRLRFTHLQFLLSGGLRLKEAHFRSVRFRSVPLIYIQTFIIGCAQDICSADDSNFRIFHDSRVHYPHIFGFATEIVEICCIWLDLLWILGITKNEVVFVWLGAAHASIRVELKRSLFHALTDPCQVSSVSINK